MRGFWGMLLVAAAGCVGPASEDILAGSVDNGVLRAVPSHDPATGLLRVRVEGAVVAESTERLQVDVWLARGGCPRYGPPGEPERPADFATVSLRDPRGEERVPYEATLRARAVEGERLHVVARPSASNAIGPVFGLCRDLVA